MRKVMALFLVAAFVGGCTVGGGGGGGKSADERDIESIIKECVDGWAEGTQQSLEAKVFPHISKNYNHAGLDHDGYIDDALDRIERRNFDVVEHSVRQNVDVNGDKAKDEYKITFQVKKEADEDIPFEVTGDADAGSIAKFKKENGEWKITSIETVDGEYTFSGSGEGAALPTLEDIAIKPADSIKPGGEFQVSGKVVFPEKAGDGVSSAVIIGLDWDYKRPNVKWRGDGNEIVFIDYPDPNGTYDFSIKLPPDGEPTAQIPEVFPLGTDAVGVSVNVYLSEQTDGSSQLLALSGFSKTVKLAGFTNEAVECQDEPLDEASPEGIWRVSSNGPGSFDFFSMIDLMSLQDAFCAAVSFPGSGTTEPISIPICGSLGGSTFTGSEEFDSDCPEGDPRKFDLTLNFSGLTASGNLTISGCGQAAVPFAITGGKVSNRCELVWQPDVIEGTWQLEGSQDYEQMELSYVGGQTVDVTIVKAGGSTRELVGKIFGNVIEAYPSDNPGIQVAQIAFDGTSGGTFFLYDEGALVLTLHFIKSGS